MNIELYAPLGGFGTTSISPFCVKLECFLRINDLPYTTKLGDVRKAPKGKVPYVSIDGEIVCDSQAIIEHLQKKVGRGADAKLTPELEALGHVVRRMVEEGLYFVLVYDRWFTDDGWAAYLPHFALNLPSALRGILPGVIRRQVKKTLRAQGTARHSRQEVYAMGAADFAALSAILGDRPYLLGDEPTSYDAPVFAMIDGISRFPRRGELVELLESHPNLVAHRDRIRARYFDR